MRDRGGRGLGGTASRPSSDGRGRVLCLAISYGAGPHGMPAFCPSPQGKSGPLTRLSGSVVAPSNPSTTVQDPKMPTA